MNQTPATSAPSAPRRRHLMDPDAPRREPDPQDLERLARVQRRVMTVLAVTTLLHLSVGLVVAADHIPADRTDARIGLNLIAGVFGIATVLSALLINGRSPKSPYLLLGLIPAAVGLWWTVL